MISKWQTLDPSVYRLYPVSRRPASPPPQSTPNPGKQTVITTGTWGLLWCPMDRYLRSPVMSHGQVPEVSCDVPWTGTWGLLWCPMDRSRTSPVYLSLGETTVNRQVNSRERWRCVQPAAAAASSVTAVQPVTDCQDWPGHRPVRCPRRPLWLSHHSNSDL